MAKRPEFTLSITLGNAAMQTGHDIARALEQAAEKLRDGHLSSNVRDENGNTVGSWWVNP